jgi:hypothetical protein
MSIPPYSGMTISVVGRDDDTTRASLFHVCSMMSQCNHKPYRCELSSNEGEPEGSSAVTIGIIHSVNP